MRSLGRTSRLILTVLAKGPAHGYAVIAWVHEVSGGAERLPVGSVYGSMDKLEQQGLIEHAFDEVEQGRTRRNFRITEVGHQRLVAEVSQLESEVAAARQAIGAQRAPSPARMKGRIA